MTSCRGKKPNWTIWTLPALCVMSSPSGKKYKKQTWALCESIDFYPWGGDGWKAKFQSPNITVRMARIPKQSAVACAITKPPPCHDIVWHFSCLWKCKFWKSFWGLLNGNYIASAVPGACYRAQTVTLWEASLDLFFTAGPAILKSNNTYNS